MFFTHVSFLGCEDLYQLGKWESLTISFNTFSLQFWPSYTLRLHSCSWLINYCLSAASNYGDKKDKPQSDIYFSDQKTTIHQSIGFQLTTNPSIHLVIIKKQLWCCYIAAKYSTQFTVSDSLCLTQRDTFWTCSPLNVV